MNCEFCNKVYSKSYLSKHSATCSMNPNKKLFNCVHCEKTYKHQSTLSNHIKEKHCENVEKVKNVCLLGQPSQEANKQEPKGQHYVPELTQGKRSSPSERNKNCITLSAQDKEEIAQLVFKKLVAYFQTNKIISETIQTTISEAIPETISEAIPQAIPEAISEAIPEPVQTIQEPIPQPAKEKEEKPIIEILKEKFNFKESYTLEESKEDFSKVQNILENDFENIEMKIRKGENVEKRDIQIIERFIQFLLKLRKIKCNEIENVKVSEYKDSIFQTYKYFQEKVDSLKKDFEKLEKKGTFSVDISKIQNEKDISLKILKLKSQIEKYKKLNKNYDLQTILMYEKEIKITLPLLKNSSEFKLYYKDLDKSNEILQKLKTKIKTV